MNYAIVSIYDAALAAYGRPFFTATTGAAVRSFTDEVNRQAEDNQIFNHPEDYTLYNLGTFDDSTGLFHPPSDSQLPLQLIKADAVKV